MVTFTLAKSERLCSRKSFESLLSSGLSYFTYPFKVIWRKMDNQEDESIKIAFTVPKRRFKRANKRNLLKRRMKEAYRLNKLPLKNYLISQNLSIQILVVYVSSDALPFNEIELKLKNVLDYVLKEVEKYNQ